MLGIHWYLWDDFALTPMGLMHDKVRHTRLRLLLEGQDTPQVVLEEFCSLWCIRGELSTVNNHQSQICLLQSEKESDPH